MFGSSIIDVAIGIIFVFLLMSLIASTVNEIIFSLMNMRGKNLLRGIQTLLNDGDSKKLLLDADGLVKDLYNHGHVYGLFQGEFEGKKSGGDLPAYIPSRNFALALLDTVPKKAAVEKLRNAIDQIADPRIKGNLSQLLPPKPAKTETPPNETEKQAKKQTTLLPPVWEVIANVKAAASLERSNAGVPVADTAKLDEVIQIANVAIGESLSTDLQDKLQAVVTAAQTLPNHAGDALASMAGIGVTPANVQNILEKMGDAAKRLKNAAPQIAVLVDSAKSEANPVQTLRKAAHLIDAKVGQPLIAMIKETSGETSKLIGEVEAWYNSAMDRCSGWYKYKTQTVLFIVGIVLAVILNANTVTIVQALSKNNTLRDSIVAAAQQYANAKSPNRGSANGTDANQPPTGEKADAATAGAPSLDDQIKKVHDQVSSLDGLGLPLGWSHAWYPSLTYVIPEAAPPAPPEDDDKLAAQGEQLNVVKNDAKVEQGWTAIAASRSRKWEPLPAPMRAQLPAAYGPWLVAWGGMLAGWLITAFAVSLGAPFWFDMLNKIMVVRSTIKPSEKSPEEASKS